MFSVCAEYCLIGTIEIYGVCITTEIAEQIALWLVLWCLEGGLWWVVCSYLVA